MSFLKQGENFTLLHVKITPNSSQNKICGTYINEKSQEYLKVQLASQPIDGKANEELIKFLAKILQIPKSKVEIISGKTSKFKMVKIFSNLQQKINYT
ncbi:MAG: YggU family protein [Pelagibacterales bacterium]|nr:YggU family protein [Pelagibacterales bacterium]